MYQQVSRLFLPVKQVGPLRAIAFRAGVALAALLATTIIVFAEGHCYSNLGSLGVSWIDALYYSTVTLTTTGYGDIVPVCESARLVNVVVITPLRFIFLIVLVGTTFEVLTTRTRAEFRARRWRNKVKNHTIIIGYGVKGRAVAETLLKSEVPSSDIVVVTNDHNAVSDISKAGFVSIVGDARRAEVLRDAGVADCRNVVIALSSDDASVLVTLTARRLSPKANIVAAARETVNMDVLRQSGADTVVPTAEAAGNLMAMSMLSPVAGEVFTDLLEPGRGVEIVERPVLDQEIGCGVGDVDATGVLVLSVVRDGVHLRFDDSRIGKLRAGDQVVVVKGHGDHE